MGSVETDSYSRAFTKSKRACECLTLIVFSDRRVPMVLLLLRVPEEREEEELRTEEEAESEGDEGTEEAAAESSAVFEASGEEEGAKRVGDEVFATLALLAVIPRWVGEREALRASASSSFLLFVLRLKSLEEGVWVPEEEEGKLLIVPFGVLAIVEGVKPTLLMCENRNDGTKECEQRVSE